MYYAHMSSFNDTHMLSQVETMAALVARAKERSA
jgi:hypothetical protein